MVTRSNSPLIIRSVLVLVLFVTSLIPLIASSTIADGVIASIENGKIGIRVHHTPYSSISTASKILTYKDGTYELRYEHLKDFFTYYIDEVPVTQEQMAAKIKPGMHVAMMENRKREYFLYVSARGMGNHFGHLKSIEENTLVLDREQKGFDKDGGEHDNAKHGGKGNESGKIVFDREHYPNQEVTVELTENAVVRHGGKTTPWQEFNWVADTGHARTRNHYLVQTPRDNMRIELVPEGFGDWHNLVTDLDTGGHGWGGREIRNQYLAIATTDSISKKSVNIRNKEAVEQNGGEKLKELSGFDSYRLAGDWDGKEDRNMWTPIYHKGQSVIVDGFYATYIAPWEQGFVTPGRIMVCFQRRGRITPDRFAISSDTPVAWGTITNIDGNALTLEAPEIANVPISGVQTLTIDANADYFHLGQKENKESVLKVGNLVQVFPARPQTILFNGG